MNMTARWLPAVASIYLTMLPGQSPGADSAAQPEKCGLKQYASLDLVITNEVWVPATIDGHSGWMVLNTGSGLSVIWDDAATELGLKRRSVASGTPIKLGKQTLRQIARFDSLALENARFGKGEFLIAQRTDDIKEPSPGTALGAIGMDVLSTVDFELDLKHRKLNLFSPDHCAGNVVYWSDTAASTPLMRGALGNYYFAVEFDDKKVEATLATGSQTTTLRTDASRKLYGFDENSPGIEVFQDPDTGDSMAHFRAMQITAPGLVVKNTRVRLLPKAGDCSIIQRRSGSKAAGYEERCHGAFPIHIGRSVLEKLRLYFATKEKMLYYTAATE